MADSLGVIGLAASGAKVLGGAAMGIIGARKQKKLWGSRPELGITEGERANDSLYRQQAAATELPGQRRAEERMDQTYATGVYDAQRTANSSLGATQAAVDLAGKKMNAVQDLGGMFAEYKSQRMDALGRWNSQKTDLENQRFDINKFQPWNIKMNEATDMKKSGFAAMGQGIDEGAGMINDMVGTDSYLKFLGKG